jgi:hypothetical protein
MLPSVSAIGSRTSAIRLRSGLAIVTRHHQANAEEPMSEHHAHPSISRAMTGLVVGILLFAMAACSGAAAASPGTGSTATNPPAAPVAVAGTPNPAASCGNPAGNQVGAAGGPLASVLGVALCGMQDVDPCSMLNQADVQALFSVPLAAPTTDHLGGCTWHLTDPSKGDGLTVSVNTGGDLSIQNDIDFHTAKPLSGVGDQAVWELLAGYFPHVGAIQGQDTCELTIGGGNGQLSVHSTGSGVFAKIDDAALPGFIDKLGALCSQIFSALGAASGPKATLPVDTAAPAPSSASGGSASGHVGDKLTFAEVGTGDAVDATLAKVYDPATPNSASEAPLPPKTHWVGVEVVIDNRSPDFANQSSEVDATTSGGDRVTTTDSFQGGAYALGSGFQGCTQTDGSEQDVHPYTHCWAFVVPDGQTLTKVGVKVGGAAIDTSLVPTDEAVWSIP